MVSNESPLPTRLILVFTVVSPLRYPSHSGGAAGGGSTPSVTYAREEVALYKPSELASRLGFAKNGKSVCLILFTGRRSLRARLADLQDTGCPQGKRQGAMDEGLRPDGSEAGLRRCGCGRARAHACGERPARDCRGGCGGGRHRDGSARLVHLTGGG